MPDANTQRRHVCRFILTGAPGSGKTSILRLLAAGGLTVVPEAATDVIAERQAAGSDQPWTDPSFIDAIVALQRLRQGEADAVTGHGQVQVYDRSPVCTLALSRYLGYQVPAALTAEVSRIARDGVYQRQAFLVRSVGSVERTAARRISLAESLEFERVHQDTYRACGFQLIDVPAGPVTDRAALVQAAIRTMIGRPGSQ
ncbi:MAG TPA: AAA family ATPase [Streptosporangiaceae bacterium]